MTTKNIIGNILYSRIQPSSEAPYLVKLLVKYRLARNEFQAVLLLFLVIIFFSGLSVFLIYGYLS